ncbi:protein sorting system archaetidylserine synthase [Halopelagius longus]|uniref:Archaetidylserine synthase n=1 Tax=Halopelagius longus TaxID=1236180 RepID=A0A1H1BLL3_9EURY|nr:protein sorting system archaetidylserine synthase [Halopelagius longus]RDI70837.1 phosphatidylcholine/phosphatidylserine synthase [Halopelagius longus]SDQ52905.1 archaetidylserine synthase [Halopelagius longus]
MMPRFVGKLGLADAVTVSNAGLGFLATVAAMVDISLAARLILLAAIADALDGVIARRRGGTVVGEYLDALADVASFGVAPAFLVATVVLEMRWAGDVGLAVGLAGAAGFVAMAVVRLGLYTAYDSDLAETKGVQTTLAATILSAGVLAGFAEPVVLVPLVYLLAALMVTTIIYPDLHAQDAIIMGVVQALAVLLTGEPGEVFAFGLLFLALAYLFFGPVFYWRRD